MRATDERGISYWLGSAALAIAVMASACGDGVAPVSECAAQHRLPGGEPCDIEEPECQAQVFAALRCVRGGTTELPPVRVISQEQYIEESTPPPESETTSEVDHWSRALALLELLPAESSVQAEGARESIANVIAYYSGWYRDITIIEQPDDDPEQAVDVLAHELAHALQDRATGSLALAERSGNMVDLGLALTTFREGEAELMEDLAHSALFNVPLHEMDLHRTYDWELRWDRGEALLSPSPYSSVRWMTYEIGAQYLLDVYEAGGPEAIDALWKQPPLTMVRWMVGPERANAPDAQWEQPFTCLPLLTPEGYRWSHADALGALVLYAFAGVHDGVPERSAEAAWRLAEGWRGDRYRVYADEAGHTALLWQVRMASEAQAEALAVAMARLEAPHRVFRDAREITLLSADDPELFDAWTKGRSCDAPEREVSDAAEAAEAGAAHGPRAPDHD